MEAVFENMELKKKVFTQIEGVCKDDALLCSNTSSLNIDQVIDISVRMLNFLSLYSSAMFCHIYGANYRVNYVRILNLCQLFISDCKCNILSRQGDWDPFLFTGILYETTGNC